MMEREGLAQQALDLLQLEQRQPDQKPMAETLVERLYRPTPGEIAIVGNMCG